MQVCFFVRGSSCAATEVDYYLLPAELESAYLHATPAADSATSVTATTTTGATAGTAATATATAGADTVSSAGATESVTTATPLLATTTTTTVIVNSTIPSLGPSPDPPAVTPKKPLRLRVRPPWLETYSEQVVLLDWPLLVPQVRYQPYHILT